MITIKTYRFFFQLVKFLPLFCALYPSKSVDFLKKELGKLARNKNYKLLVAFDDNTPIAIANIHQGFLIFCGEYLQISSLYVDAKYRNKGIAKILIDEAEKYAKKYHCKYLLLDSYIDNEISHKIYLKAGFEKKAYHFMKEI